MLRIGRGFECDNRLQKKMPEGECNQELGDGVRGRKGEERRWFEWKETGVYFGVCVLRRFVR